MVGRKNPKGRHFVIPFVTLALAWSGSTLAADICPSTLAACLPGEIDAIPKANYRSPSHFITLTPSAYSDFMIVNRGPFPQQDPRDAGGATPLHELMSGELATAISYNGMLVFSRALRASSTRLYA